LRGAAFIDARVSERTIQRLIIEHATLAIAFVAVRGTARASDLIERV
jgi:hypothetical protein